MAKSGIPNTKLLVPSRGVDHECMLGSIVDGPAFFGVDVKSRK
jgi:hypothetical protein